MVTQSQKIRLGIFIALASFALLLTIGIIVAPKLFEVRDTYYVGFKDVTVTGLQDGSDVKYQGLTVGYVSDIFIDPDDISTVIVELSLEHGTPIKEDSRAEMAYFGIMGMKVVQLRSGSDDAEFMKPGSYITPGRSIAESITGSAEIIAEKMEIILNNIATLTESKNRDTFLALAENASKTLAELHDLLQKNKRSLTNTFANIEILSADMQDVVLSTKGTMQHINRLAESDTLRRIMGNLADISESLKRAELIRLVREMNEALESTTNMLRVVERTFTKSNTDLVYSIESMKESAEYFNQFARMISEDPSVLVRGTKPKDAPDYKLEK
ncbi:MAG: MCE family protein [Deltaproteobacteria bacterium]|nr:MCE family protein [Deltaproteobacteria bacterium]